MLINHNMRQFLRSAISYFNTVYTTVSSSVSVLWVYPDSFYKCGKNHKFKLILNPVNYTTIPVLNNCRAADGSGLKAFDKSMP